MMTWGREKADRGTKRRQSRQLGGREGGTDTLLLLVVGVSVLEVTYFGGEMTEIVIYYNVKWFKSFKNSLFLIFCL